MDNLFATVLAEARGNMLAEASLELRRVIEAIKETGKKGSLTVTLNITPEDGDATAVSLDTVIKANVPKAPKPKSIRFIDGDFGLIAQDPKQVEMFAERERRGVQTLRGVSGDMIAAG